MEESRQMLFNMTKIIQTLSISLIFFLTKRYLCIVTMKKASLIILLCLYALSISGIGIKQFYCCGELSSTTISFVQEVKEKCGQEDRMGDCCRTNFTSLKVKDNHIAADGIYIPVKQIINLHLLTLPFQVPVLVNQPMDVACSSHPPPVQLTVPSYILHCIYRI